MKLAASVSWAERSRYWQLTIYHVSADTLVPTELLT
jgi:hypothetical protein